MRQWRDMRFTRKVAEFWLLTGLVLLLLFIPLPTELLAIRWPALTNEIEDFGHPVVFAVLTYLAHVRVLASKRWNKPALVYLISAAGALFFGFATEAAQAMIGRDSSWNDLRNDMLGASFALLVHAHSSQQQPARRRMLAAAAGTVAALAVAPLATTAAAYVHRSNQKPVLWQKDDYLFEYFSALQGGAFPGLLLKEVSPDWRSWQFLDLDIESLQPTSTNIHVRVHDRGREFRRQERFHTAFSLPAGRRAVLRIPLDSIRQAPGLRAFDLGSVGGMMVFSRGRSAQPRFTVHSIRLSRKALAADPLPPVPVVEPHDIILPQVGTRLHFDDVQRYLPGILDAVLLADGDIGGLVFLQQEHSVSASDTRCAGDHDPVFGTVMMQLQ